MKTFNVEKYMSKHPYLTSGSITAQEAYEKMDEAGVRHLPVIDGYEIVGVISQRDLKQVIKSPEAEKILVADLMTKNPYMVREGTPLIDVIKEMKMNKYGCAVVVDDSQWITGIFTTIDALTLLEDLLTGQTDHEIGVSPIESYLGTSQRQPPVDSRVA